MLIFIVHLILVNPIVTLLVASSLDAVYDSTERFPAPGCLPGTCEDVIAKILEWIYDSNDRPIFWLNGPAGAGKSALAQTTAEFCKREEILGASFFFSRDSANRKSLRQFLPTISYQLTQSVPSFASVLTLGSSIPQGLCDQVRALLVDPFSGISRWDVAKTCWLDMQQFRPRVIVIDALDECCDADLVHELILLIATIPKHYQFPLKFFFTSRPEAHIRETFMSLEVDSKTRSLALDDFDAQANIQIFLRHGFADIYQKHHHIMHTIPQPWPSDEDIQSLVGMSSGLFTFASTLLKFVDGEQGNPSQRLQSFLDLDRGSNTLEYAGLDQLYRQIFAASLYTPRTRLVVGTIALLIDPLPLVEIDYLLGLKNGEGWQSLHGLYFIFFISSEQNMPIRMFHASLYDFLTCFERSAQYFIDPVIHHASLAHLCLDRIMADLKRDVGGIEDPLSLGHNTGKHSYGSQRINRGLRYACCYWASHLSLASHDRKILDVLKKFSSTTILYWIEALSITGDLKFALPSLQQVNEWLKVSAVSALACWCCIYTNISASCLELV